MNIYIHMAIGYNKSKDPKDKNFIHNTLSFIKFKIQNFYKTDEVKS